MEQKPNIWFRRVDTGIPVDFWPREILVSQGHGENCSFTLHYWVLGIISMSQGVSDKIDYGFCRAHVWIPRMFQV